MNFTLYGPPGVGKSAIGKLLAAKLGRDFVDTDVLVEERAGMDIPRIFAERGEAEFRRLESELCVELGSNGKRGTVIALGGGALLNPENRTALERHGVIFCLRAPADELLARLGQSGQRPLLAGENPAGRLADLLAARQSLYDSFPEQVSATGRVPAQVVDDIARRLAPRTLIVDAPDLHHSIALGYGLFPQWPALLMKHGLTGGPGVIVTDENLRRVAFNGHSPLPILTLPSGEEYKTLASIRGLYESFLKHGLDRNGVVLAVGGGVIGDTAGFAAATFMRGIRWVNLPTTLLSMVDASLGGKTGVDLPEGKNLVGAFHPPVLVISDPLLLNTLPRAERISGMGEVVKHGVIGDPALFESLESDVAFGSIAQIERAIAVKVRVVEADPFEKGERATLNLGHTIGHGVESVSGYRVRHGEAVAIGMAAEAWLAEKMRLAESGLAARIVYLLKHVGLPVQCPGLDPLAIRTAMSADKKKAGGALKFALPKKVGEVVWGVEVDEALLMEAIGRAVNGEW
jgi:shikimate kinase/3-dehydroquinate synthase